MKFIWVKIFEITTCNGIEISERAKIKGGWLVKNSNIVYVGDSVAMSESMIFVQDAAHVWHVE